ncbi:hypothetical protein DM02DRAFT_635820 [Periconia macrospinosa]|uniref:IGFBP N-terminal domain-containing protein n=1 Tax=Periconia macrospinosa TaxID=97972 RepID=A0A2V1D1K8_9PLEO|nr:hypothetical protein DM02DRAFT_635820 [Periconia macrospinosa]
MSRLIRIAVLTLIGFVSAQLTTSTLSSTSRACDCFTATVYTSQPNCGPPTPCIGQPCIKFETSIIPKHNTLCPKTPTTTSTYPCATECPKGCQTATSTLTGGFTCARATILPTPTFASPRHKRTEPLELGEEGDECGRFRFPPDPPCGPNLTCVLTNPQVPDLGGTCAPKPTSTPTPTPVVGHEGDPCNRFRVPRDPPCAPDLTCVLTNPQIPDLGGVCRRRQSTSPSISPPPTPSPTSSPPPLTTTPTRTRPCPTRTVTSPDHCPEDLLGCPYDCVVLSTTTVPPKTIPGCPITTPVVTLTMSRSCRGTCYGSCSTTWVTRTADEW